MYYVVWFDAETNREYTEWLEIVGVWTLQNDEDVTILTIEEVE